MHRGSTSVAELKRAANDVASCGLDEASQLIESEVRPKPIAALVDSDEQDAIATGWLWSFEQWRKSWGSAAWIASGWSM